MNSKEMIEIFKELEKHCKPTIPLDKWLSKPNPVNIDSWDDYQKIFFGNDMKVEHE